MFSLAVEALFQNLAEMETKHDNIRKRKRPFSTKQLRVRKQQMEWLHDENRDLYFEGETTEGWLHTMKCLTSSCKKMVTIGHPYCKNHARKAFGVQIDVSQIAGTGLFATRGFVPGDWICPYMGESLTEEELDNRYPDDSGAPYTIAFDGVIEDAAFRRGIGSLINHASEKYGANVDYVIREGWKKIYPKGLRTAIWIRCIAKIAEGDEILSNYGKNYDMGAKHSTLWRKRMKENNAM
jgi:hypothetical protein